MLETMAAERHEAHAIFSEWSIYRKVVENDYMHHNEVTRVIDRVLRELPSGYSVLDLGCGDAEVVARLASEGRIGGYCGVDQSQAALDAARKRLEGHIEEVELVQANLLGFVESASHRFDVVLCGYTLHHLSTEQKRDFLRFVSRVLKPGGVMMVYDVFRGDSESREAFLESYIDWIATDWTSIPTGGVRRDFESHAGSGLSGHGCRVP